MKLDKLVEIIHGCKDNNRFAQKELYYLVKDRLYTIAYRITGDWQLANDVLQEGLIDIFNSISKLKEPTSFYAWAKMIIVRKAYAIIKKEKAKTTEELDVNLKTESVQNEMDVEYIEKAIQELPVKARAVFILAEIEGFAHKEIAENLDISIGTSKSQLNYAKKKLKLALGLLT